jgi:hypothetical protein
MKTLLKPWPKMLTSLPWVMVVTFEYRDGGTEVTILFEQIPPGIRPEDNDAGTRSSLEKLAHYVE